MADLSPVPTIPLSDSKELFSLAYMWLLAAKGGLSLTISGRSEDNLGLDCSLSKTVNNRTVGANTANLRIQIKCTARSSTTMIIFDEKNEQLKYKISGGVRNTYNDHYLILVVMPEDSDYKNWCRINPKEVLLKAEAFYYKITKVLQDKEQITIPFRQRLSLENAEQILKSSVKRKEDL